MDVLILVYTLLTANFMGTFYSYDCYLIHAGNFPFLSPLFKWIVKRAPQGKGMQVLIETAISMLQARRQNEEETKVLCYVSSSRPHMNS